MNFREMMVGAGLGLSLAGATVAQGTIKVGMLNSLSGTMAISETS